MAIVYGNNNANLINLSSGATNGDDTIYGLGGDDQLYGGGGWDDFYGGLGADYINGGTGNDEVLYLDSTVAVGINLGAGYGFGGTGEGDRFVSIESAVGSNFNDTLIGSAESNILFGAAGNDFIMGGEHPSYNGFDMLAGGTGDDTLKGGGGADQLNGQQDNDTLIGGGGADKFYAGSGYDMLAYDGSPDRVWVSLRTGTALFGDAQGDWWEFVEDLRGSSFNDILEGDAYDNHIYGMDGADTLKGGGGADALVGGNGNDQMIGDEGDDWLNGGSGNDIMTGGNGQDFYFVDSVGDYVYDGVGQGTGDRVFASASYTLTVGAEIEKFSTMDHAGTAAINLTGNALANTIFGNAGANVLNGAAGADTLVGFGGDDFFFVDNAADAVVESAGEGINDRVFASTSYALNAGTEIEVFSTTLHVGTDAIDLTGNELGNSIFGNAGANTINGRFGNDTLYGFGGSDAFVFDSALNPFGNVDAIGDFGADDTIILSQSIFPTIAPGVLSAGAFVIGPEATTDEHRIVYDSATGALFYDAAGTAGGTAMQFATLSPGLALTAEDFVIA